MARWEESVKRREWSERLIRFARWDGTVAEFCDAERVSAPSFYHWRRNLAASGVGADPGNSRCSTPERCSARETPRTFVPVQLVSTTSAESASAATVEIELPNGALIHLPPDRELLTAAITAAGQVAASPRGQPSSREEEAEDARC